MNSPNTVVLNLTQAVLRTATAESAQERHPWRANLALLIGLAICVLYGLMVERYLRLPSLPPTGLEDSWLSAMLDDVTLLGLCALAVPLLMVICVRLFHLSRPQVSPHQLRIHFDETGLTVQRGATRMQHGWSAVRQVRVREPIGKLQGSIVIHLEYGFVHAWPSKAFDSVEAFRHAAHKIAALHLEHAAAAASEPVVPDRLDR